MNPEDEAIEIVNSENVSVGGARNVSLRDSQRSHGEKSLLVPLHQVRIYRLTS